MSPISNTARARDQRERTSPPVSIRAYAPGYLAVSLILAFFAIFSLYLSYVIASAIMLAIAIVLVPILGFTDKIVLDRKRLTRTGIIPRIWFRLNGLRRSIKVRNIEQVDTITVGSFRRGGRVRFMHRTSVFG